MSKFITSVLKGFVQMGVLFLVAYFFYVSIGTLIRYGLLWHMLLFWWVSFTLFAYSGRIDFAVGYEDKRDENDG